MGTTPRYNLPYAEPNDLVRNHPNVVSRPLAERVESIVGTLSDDVADLADDQTAGDAATLAAAKSHADAGDAATLSTAKAHADRTTGERNISDMLSKSGGLVLLRRTGSVVFLYLQQVRPLPELGSGQTMLNALPVGFRPTGRRNFSLSTGLGSSTFRSAFQFPTGAIGVWLPSPDDQYTIERVYHTSDAWPTLLPGTPA